MFNSGSWVRTLRLSSLHSSGKRLSLWTPALTLLLVAGVVAGCNTKQEQALNQAKEQAAKTGQPQQMVSVDKNGTTTTTIVQPPAPGETSEAMMTTTRPHSVGAPDSAALGTNGFRRAATASCAGEPDNPRRHQAHHPD